MPMIPQAPGAMPPEQMGDDMGSTDDRFREAIELLQSVLVEEPDDADSAALAAVVQNLYKILATREAERDKMMGMQPAQARLMRRGA